MNFRTRTIRATSALPLLLAGGILALSCSTAQAQRATLTQDTESAARVPYQEGLTASCSFPGDCALIFSAVPAGKRRVIEYISCLVQLTSSGALETLSLNATSFRNARGFFPVYSSPGLPSGYIVNSTTQLYFNAGETPRVDAFTNAPVSLALCTLTGREITL